MKHFLVAIIFMLMSSAMKIYASDMRFYNADNTYGITIREPSSICKDDDGFMWVATKSGIYRLSDESKCYNVPYTTVNIVSVELVHRKENSMCSPTMVKYSDITSGSTDLNTISTSCQRSIQKPSIWLTLR